MCGIAGYAGVHRPELLEPMCAAMVHRGPDSSGTWHDAAAGVGFGHRRLSIIDLSPAGHQPMASPDGSVVLTYNGELYNFQEHRERLARAGRRFRGQSDTEVLLALYEERGVDFLRELNGMFAFGLWDARDRSLLLARDHAGIKPLYYWQQGPRIYFASEIKALLAIPELARSIDHESLRDYLTYLWVPGDRTLLEGVRKLEPGHLLRWQDGRSEVRRWFELRYDPDPRPSEADWTEAVHDVFMRTTERQMVSDVPLGAFLSGGLDSSSIVACMRRSFPERRIKAYTIEFESGDIAREQGADDLPYAKRVAESFDVELQSIRLKPDVVSLLPKLIWHLDEPDADTAIFPSYLIARAARDDGTTVLLSGTGGDEVFFGYRTHQAWRHYQRLAALAPALVPASRALGAAGAALFGATNRITRRVRKFGRGLAHHGLERHMALADWSRDDVREWLLIPELRPPSPTAGERAFGRYAAAFAGEGELNFHSHLLIQTFLAAHNFLYTDKTSMAASIETRVPFMDLELMRLAARIPESMQIRGGVTKLLLKRAMERHLPRDVIYRPKTGFGTPVHRWVRHELRGLIEDVLGEERVAARGVLDPKGVRRVLDENAAGTGDHTYLIFGLLTLELWQRTFIDRPGVEIAL